MKNLTSILVAVVTAGLIASGAEAAALGKQLAELESHIKWEAVESAWKNARTDWVRTTAGCDDDPACVAAQLLKLEQNVKWAAVDADWKKRRTGWISDCKEATTEAAVASLLLEFEGNVRWRAVDEGWKARRDNWVAEIKGD